MALVHEDITGDILACAIEVHHVLGPGLLESSYEACLAWELAGKRLRVCRRVALPVPYKHQRLDRGYRVDLIVDESVIVELKAMGSHAVCSRGLHVSSSGTRGTAW
ncbi:MAG: GxxExxY protein [Planctomycetota bacterium]|nr:GxxExxY protein [Planctomycetota bacterium]